MNSSSSAWTGAVNKVKAMGKKKKDNGEEESSGEKPSGPKLASLIRQAMNGDTGVVDLNQTIPSLELAGIEREDTFLPSLSRENTIELDGFETFRSDGDGDTANRLGALSANKAKYSDFVMDSVKETEESDFTFADKLNTDGLINTSDEVLTYR
ncbi:hypothetical protein ACF0H5_011362 [Mactra antiquata]